MAQASYLRIKLFMILMIVSVQSQLSVFLVDPVSVAAVNGTTVQFSCTASDATFIVYFVNGSSAGGQDVQEKGFIELGAETLGGTIRRKNLTVTVSSQYNNTEIKCTAVGINSGDSETATLTVQGPLSSVGDLSSFINSSTVNISWSPPFTLLGSAITGYNISVTSNGTTTSYFTSDSYYVLQLSDITDSPCNEINITVSGYNGLNGETDSLLVPSSNPVVPLSVIVKENLQLNIAITVTDVCIDERLTTVDIALFKDDMEVFSMDFMFIDNARTENLTLNITYTVLEDTVYTIKVSFYIFEGHFEVSSKQMFNTFGVQSIDINDTTEDSVFFNCTFHSFSTDTGCTVQLLLSDVIWYAETYSKSGSTATGSIFGVATGLYLVKVFDENNSIVVLTLELMVIGEPATTTCTTTTSVTSSPPMNLPSVPSILPFPTTSAYLKTMSSSVNPVPTSEVSKLGVAIAVPIGVLVIILVIVSLTLLGWWFVWKKRKHDNSTCDKRNDSFDINMDTNPAYGEVQKSNTKAIYETVQ